MKIRESLMAEKFKVGDKVQVQYLTDEWHDVTVVRMRQVTAKEAAEFDLKAGDDVLICDDGSGDTRGFLASKARREEIPVGLTRDIPATKPPVPRNPAPRKR